MKAVAVFVVAAGLGISGAASAATVYDAVADFSLSSNPNGTWAYGAGSGSFTALPNAVIGGFSGNSSFEFWQSATPQYEVPLVAKNIGSSTISFGSLLSPTNVLLIHPGVSSDVIVQWTAPTAGTYSYAGLFELLDTSPSGVIGSVYTSSSTLYQGALNGVGANQSTNTPGASETFGGRVSLNQGDTLSFVVNNAGSVFNDSTGFNATISAVPEPATWAIFLMGFGVIGWSLRQSRKGGLAFA